MPNSASFVGAADIYLTPYLNESQIASGTLAYCFGAGKAVVSTPYWQCLRTFSPRIEGFWFPFRGFRRLLLPQGTGFVLRTMRAAMRCASKPTSSEERWCGPRSRQTMSVSLMRLGKVFRLADGVCRRKAQFLETPWLSSHSGSAICDG
jgi:hypothetical protein